MTAFVRTDDERKINLEVETRQNNWMLHLFRQDSRSKRAAVVVVFVPGFYPHKRRVI